MENKVIEIISKITKIPAENLKEKSNEKNIWDSLRHMEIIIALEDEFDITFENEDIADAKTINLIIETVRSKAK